MKKTLLFAAAAALLTAVPASFSLTGTSYPVCHFPPGNIGNEHTVWVGSQNAVAAHVANHPGDYAGVCQVCDSSLSPESCPQ